MISVARKLRAFDVLIELIEDAGRVARDSRDVEDYNRAIDYMAAADRLLREIRLDVLN